jgi:hypothetical protein
VQLYKQLRQPARDCRSHSPNHGVEGGRVNEGPTCCAGKLYWGDAKKACDVDQYGAPPTDGSKKDGQAGCTGKPCWGIVKKTCDGDQYGAPPMDGQAGVPMAAPPAVVPAGAPATAVVAQGPTAPKAVLVGAPMVAVASKGPTTPATGPTGVLASAARKRRPVGEWPVTVPAAVPTGAPTMAAAAKRPAGALTPTATKGGLTEGWGGWGGGGGARGGSYGVASGCDGTHNTPTEGGGDSLKGGNGRSQGSRSDADGG